MAENDQHQYKDRYMLRLPDGMRERIKAAAEANNRSMNAEIVLTLEEAYPSPLYDDPEQMIHLVDSLESIQKEIDKCAESLQSATDSDTVKDLSVRYNSLFQMQNKHMVMLRTLIQSAADARKDRKP